MSNVDDKSIVKNALAPVIVARFIRIHPKTWNNHISMRAEFLGCFEGIYFYYFSNICSQFSS